MIKIFWQFISIDWPAIFRWAILLLWLPIFLAAWLIFNWSYDDLLKLLIYAPVLIILSVCVRFGVFVRLYKEKKDFKEAYKALPYANQWRDL